MNSVATVPAGPALQGLEDKLREQLQTTQRTSFGSEYVAFHTSRDEVIALAECEWVSTFRRVMLDPVRGLVMLMVPSIGHEDVSGDVDDFVSSVATLKGIKARKLRATRWRREEEPKNTGNEADCSFYFGRKAENFVKVSARGRDEADAYSCRVPPDLVVEAGLTHIAREKYLSYRDKGVVEFWQLQAHPRKRGRSVVTVTFLDLQAQPQPLQVDTSLNLPGITPAHVAGFIRKRSGKLLDNYEVLDAVRSLLEDENSGTMIRENAEEYATAG